MTHNSSPVYRARIVFFSFISYRSSLSNFSLLPLFFLIENLQSLKDPAYDTTDIPEEKNLDEINGD